MQLLAERSRNDDRLPSVSKKNNRTYNIIKNNEIIASNNIKKQKYLQVYVFKTQFYGKFVKTGFAGVKRWTKNVRLL